MLSCCGQLRDPWLFFILRFVCRGFGIPVVEDRGHCGGRMLVSDPEVCAILLVKPNHTGRFSPPGAAWVEKKRRAWRNPQRPKGMSPAPPLSVGRAFFLMCQSSGSQRPCHTADSVLAPSPSQGNSIPLRSTRDARGWSLALEAVVHCPGLRRERERRQ